MAFIQVQEMAFKGLKGRCFRTSKLSSINLQLESFIGSVVDIVIAGAANGSTEKLIVGTRDASMLTVTGRLTDAAEI